LRLRVEEYKMEDLGGSSVSVGDANHEQLKEENARYLRELAAVRREAETNALLAKAAREELQHFVYAASHDLQQPLRTVATHAQLLQREFPDHPRAKEFAAVIVESATEMNTLVSDLLNYSRVGNDPRLAGVSLSSPLQWAIYKLGGLITELGGKVETDDLPEVLADEKQIAIVFEHLLKNSLLYRSQTPVLIKVSAEEQDDGYTISVQDNGEGIKPDYHEKVFEPFKRLHSKEVPGSGLGLAICRKILHAHQGRIWVESDGEHGSTVKFTLSS
jgi:light-regulated signal transduction histidine kinase (bacteriophytochrome)